MKSDKRDQCTCMYLKEILIVKVLLLFYQQQALQQIVKSLKLDQKPIRML